MKRLGKTAISYEELERALRLPEGMRIAQVEQSADDRVHDQIVLYLSGEELPEVQPREIVRAFTIDLTARIR
jgi:hypothetical protein